MFQRHCQIEQAATNFQPCGLDVTWSSRSFWGILNILSSGRCPVFIVNTLSCHSLLCFFFPTPDTKCLSGWEEDNVCLLFFFFLMLCVCARECVHVGVCHIQPGTFCLSVISPISLSPTLPLSPPLKLMVTVVLFKARVDQYAGGTAVNYGWPVYPPRSSRGVGKTPPLQKNRHSYYSSKCLDMIIGLGVHTAWVCRANRSKWRCTNRCWLQIEITSHHTAGNPKSWLKSSTPLLSSSSTTL